jgi:hypothetical protein
MTLIALRRERRLTAVPDQPESCTHDQHITHDGQRLGANVHPSRQYASLQPCEHTNKDGK